MGWSHSIGSSQHLAHACIVKFGFAAGFISSVRHWFILAHVRIGLPHSLPVGLAVARPLDMSMRLRIGHPLAHRSNRWLLCRRRIGPYGGPHIGLAVSLSSSSAHWVARRSAHGSVHWYDSCLAPWRLSIRFGLPIGLPVDQESAQPLGC